MVFGALVCKKFAKLRDDGINFVNLWEISKTEKGILFFANCSGNHPFFGHTTVSSKPCSLNTFASSNTWVETPTASADADNKITVGVFNALFWLKLALKQVRIVIKK